MTDYTVNGEVPLKYLYYYKPPQTKPTLFYFPNDLDQLPARACAIEEGIEPNVGKFVALRMGYEQPNDIIKFVKKDIQPNVSIWYLIKDRDNELNLDNILSISAQDFQKYKNNIEERGETVRDEIDCASYIDDRYIPIINEEVEKPFIFTPPRQTMLNQHLNEIGRIKSKLSARQMDVINISPRRPPPPKSNPNSNIKITSSYAHTPIQSSADESSNKTVFKPFRYTVISPGTVPSTEPSQMKTSFGPSLSAIKNKGTKDDFVFETPNNNRTMNPAQRQRNIMNRTFDSGSSIPPTTTTRQRPVIEDPDDRYNRDYKFRMEMTAEKKIQREKIREEYRKEQMQREAKGNSPKEDFGNK